LLVCDDPSRPGKLFSGRPQRSAQAHYASLGKWMVPGSGQADYADIIARAVKYSVVLLGETYVNADYHCWQL